MVTINYYLKGTISDKNIEELQKAKDPSLNKTLRTPRQVYLTVSGLGKRIQIYTKRRISQYEWDKEMQQVDCRKNKVNGTELNNWLMLFKQAVTKQNSANESTGKTTTITDLRNIMDSITPTGAKKITFSFQDHFERFLKEHKTGKGHSKKDQTIQKYNTFNAHLIKFAEKKKIRLQIEVIDGVFLSSFKDYLVKDLKLGDNTVGKYIKAAKTLIRFYINAGLIKPFNYTEIKSVEKEGEIYTKTLEFHDGVRKEEYVPFYKVLTTHVARKSYITNSLIIGVPERVVKEVSGHKSEKDFRRYVNLANSYKDEMIRKSYSVENISKYL